MNKQDRPLLLSAAIFLSLIGSSVATLVYFSAAVFFGQTKELVEKLTNIQAPQNLSAVYMAVFGVLYGLSLLGVIKMHKMQRSGLSLYAFAQISLLILPLAWIGTQAFSSTNTIFTLLFITIYGIHRKRLQA
ncbi:MAG: hypothetical protein AAGU19_22240 [Prolixibacteraceae bacterium]